MNTIHHGWLEECSQGLVYRTRMERLERRLSRRSLVNIVAYWMFRALIWPYENHKRPERLSRRMFRVGYAISTWRWERYGMFRRG